MGAQGPAAGLDELTVQALHMGGGKARPVSEDGGQGGGTTSLSQLGQLHGYYRLNYVPSKFLC